MQVGLIWYLKFYNFFQNSQLTLPFVFPDLNATEQSWVTLGVNVNSADDSQNLSRNLNRKWNENINNENYFNI